MRQLIYNDLLRLQKDAFLKNVITNKFQKDSLQIYEIKHYGIVNVF
jgi:hypothetical protein